MSEKAVSVEVPFVPIGNRRGLTDEQLFEDAYLRDFVSRFPASFEYDPFRCVHLFVEPGAQS